MISGQLSVASIGLKCSLRLQPAPPIPKHHRRVRFTHQLTGFAADMEARSLLGAAIRVILDNELNLPVLSLLILRTTLFQERF